MRLGQITGVLPGTRGTRAFVQRGRGVGTAHLWRPPPAVLRAVPHLRKGPPAPRAKESWHATHNAVDASSNQPISIFWEALQLSGFTCGVLARSP